MKTVNPLLTRLVVKTSKPRNHVFLALTQRRGGAGVHVKPHGALRRAEKMATTRVLLRHEDD